MSRFGWVTWILTVTVWRILPAVLGINESASSTNLQPATEETSLQTSIKLSTLTNSTINAGLHTTQLKDNGVSNIIANSSDASGIQTSYSSNKMVDSIWSHTATPQIKTSYLPQGTSSRNSYSVTKGAAKNSFSTKLLSILTSGMVTLSTTQKMSITTLITLQSSFKVNASLSKTITKSASEYQDINTENIPLQTTSTIAVGHTINPRLTTRTNIKSFYTRIVSSQSPQHSGMSVSQQEQINSTVVITTASPGTLYDSQSTRNNFTNTGSLQTTVTRANLTETTISSFQAKESKGSLAETPTAGVTMHQTVRDNKSFSLNFTSTESSSILKTSSKVSSPSDSVTEGSESFPTSSTTVLFVPKTTPKVQPITSYKTSDINNTINLGHISKFADSFTQMTMSTSRGSLVLTMIQNSASSIHVMNSSGFFAVVNATLKRASLSSARNDSTMCPSHLRTQSKTFLMHTIVSSATNTFMISKIHKTTDVMSEVDVTVSNTTVFSTSMTTNRPSVKPITASYEITQTTDISLDFHATVLTSGFPDSTVRTASVLFQHSTSIKEKATLKPTTIFLEVTTSSPPYSSAPGIMTASMSLTAIEKSPVSHSELSKQVTSTYYTTPTKTYTAFSSSVEASGKRLNTSNIGTFIGKSHSTHLFDVVVPDTSNIISTNTIKSTFSVSNQSRTTPMPTASSTLLAKVLITTSIVDQSDSLLRSQTLTPVSTLSLVVSSDPEPSGSITQKTSQIVSMAVNDTTSPLPDSVPTAASSSSTENNFSSTTGLASVSNTTIQNMTSVSSSNLTSVGDTLTLQTSSVKYISSKSRSSSEKTLSITSESSTRHSLQQLSTPRTDNVMHSITSHTGYPNMLVSTTLLHSSRTLPPKSIHFTQALTSVPSSTQPIPVWLGTLPTTTPQGTPHTLATSEKYSSIQSSQTISRELVSQNVSPTVTTPRLSPTSEERSNLDRSTVIDRPFTTYHTVKSSFLLNSSTTHAVVLTSQVTVSAKITSSSNFTFGLSSIAKDSQKHSELVSSSYISKLGSSASFLHASLISTNVTGLASTSAATLKFEISELNTMISQFSATSLHPIKSTKQTFGPVSSNALLGYSSLTLSSKKKHTLNNTKTQTSTVLQIALTVTRSSKIAIDTTVTLTTKTLPPVTSASASTQTEPPLEIPSQFEGRMILGMQWKPEYEYPPQSQTLSTTITEKLTNVLKNLQGFISVRVLRLWKSSVGVDFIVYVRKGAQVNESVVERTLIEANRTGVLDLPLTSIQVKEKEATTTPSPPTTTSTDKDKSFERWIIILIVAGILVFLLSLIICILVVKLMKQRGGLRRSGKYELSSFNNFLYSERTEPGSKPVILRMEERKRDAKESRVAVGLYDVYGVTNSNSEESLAHNEGGSTPTDDHTYYSISEYRNSHKDSTTAPSIVEEIVEERTKEVQEDPHQDSTPLNESTTSSKEYADKSNFGYRNSHEDIKTSMTVESQLNETKQNFEDPVALNTCANGDSEELNEATSSSSRTPNEGDRQVKGGTSTDEEGAHQNQSYKNEESCETGSKIRAVTL